MTDLSTLRANYYKAEYLRSLPRPAPVLTTYVLTFHTTTVGTLSINVVTNSGGEPVIADYGDGSSRVALLNGWNTHAYTQSGTKTFGIYPQRLDRIKRIYMYGQNLTGNMPDFLACTDMDYLLLMNNALTGQLPSFAGCVSLTNIDIGTNQLTGQIPSFETCTALVQFTATLNSFVGELPSFAACTAMTYINVSGCVALGGILPSFSANVLLDTMYAGDCNFSGAIPSFAACTVLRNCDLNKANFSGSLPTFAACVLLERFWCNQNSLTGTIPNFAPCTKLIAWNGDINGFTGYTAGSFATQANLSDLSLFTNSLPQAAVDAVLADCVTSLAIPGRVVCNLQLYDNAVPSAAGLVSKGLLVAAGWTVVTD